MYHVSFPYWLSLYLPFVFLSFQIHRLGIERVEKEWEKNGVSLCVRCLSVLAVVRVKRHFDVFYCRRKSQSRTYWELGVAGLIGKVVFLILDFQLPRFRRRGASHHCSL